MTCGISYIAHSIACYQANQKMLLMLSTCQVLIAGYRFQIQSNLKPKSWNAEFLPKHFG